MGKSSQKWWEEVKANPIRFNSWLIRQYRGEVTAAKRIVEFADKFCTEVKAKNVLQTIAEQEEQHAQWILELLQARNITPVTEGAEKRYWKETLPDITSFETGCAVGAHAERMRLERIRVISEDESAPTDVRETFKKILKDELFHERAFRYLAGPTAMVETIVSHRRGREALGLEP